MRFVMWIEVATGFAVVHGERNLQSGLCGLPLFVQISAGYVTFYYPSSAGMSSFPTIFISRLVASFARMFTLVDPVIQTLPIPRRVSKTVNIG